VHCLRGEGRNDANDATASAHGSDRRMTTLPVSGSVVALVAVAPRRDAMTSREKYAVTTAATRSEPRIQNGVEGVDFHVIYKPS
jgi:hypothetical protein